MFGHVSSLNLYDPPPRPAAQVWRRPSGIILEKLDQLAPFRRRLAQVPFGLDLPYWVEDPDFDIDFHVRHHAVPPPGTPEQLAEVVSRIVARPLDRSRPLRELYVIEGVEDGADRPAHQGPSRHDRRRVRGADARRLLDTDPDFRPAGGPHRGARAIPTHSELLRRDARIRPPAGEAAPPDRPHDPRGGGGHGQRRPPGPHGSRRPADARPCRQPMPPACERATARRWTNHPVPPTQAPVPRSSADHPPPPPRVHHDPPRSGARTCAGPTAAPSTMW